MTNDISRRALLRGVGAVGIGAGALALFPSMALAAPLTQVLLFASTAGSRHGSVPVGVASIHQLADPNGHVGADTCAPRNTAHYEAVVWRSTPTRRIPFGSYVNSGGSYVGVHDAAGTWDWYGSCVGGYFAARPTQQQATLVVEDRMTDSTARLPATWDHLDEWREFRGPPSAVRVLVRVAEPSRDGGTPGADRPVEWWHGAGAGRAWYTGLGHTTESHSDAVFIRMVMDGIRVAVRAVPAGSGEVERVRERPVADLEGR